MEYNMGALNVFCMIAGFGMALMALVDYRIGNGWKVWGTSLALAILNLYFAFEPAIAGRVPFTV
jgi:hypothetical protein